MAKTIMIQGTMSGAGKSLLCAGLCRIFREDGYRVLPFKSQNMALNSFVTEEGLEMGRAQVLQAEAAGVTPSVDMNPVLLKPTGDTGSQVIVNGEVLGTMQAADYFAFKKQLVPQILAAFDRLAARADVIVIEGAGSPAEINLRENDIVNMGLAELLDAPVLLAGDIDRGGVFAQLYGTLALLQESERARVKGLIINKFRGDPAILAPGITMLEEKCGKRVLGTVPFLDIALEDEDSLSDRFRQKAPAAVDLAVVRFPRISNFTDFDAFEPLPGVSLRYVSRPSELKTPDLIFLPGSKNTIDDLRWMRESGMEAAVKKRLERGTVVFGICGGYQMLGAEVRDPEGAETGQRNSTIRGMELLPLVTVMEGQKTRRQVEGRFLAMDGPLAAISGSPFRGYEIHMGTTGPAVEAAPDIPEAAVRPEAVSSHQEAAEPLFKSAIPQQPSVFLEAGDLQTGERAAGGYQRGLVYGCYVHGLFDRGDLAGRLAKCLADRKGVRLEDPEYTDFGAFREQEFRKLSRALRQSLDMDAIYSAMGLSGGQNREMIGEHG